MRHLAGRLTGKLGLAVMVTLLLALTLTAVGFAQPATPDAPDFPGFPHFFWGKVFTDKGIQVSEGAEVLARSTRAATGGWTGTMIDAVDADGNYGYGDTGFYVPGLDPAEPGSGAVSGEPIAFYVLGVRAQVYGVATSGPWSDTYLFSPAGHTEVNLRAAIKQTITATAGPNGTISPSGAVSVDYGFNQKFTFTPADNYLILDVLVDGVSKPAAVTAGEYTFQNVRANHTIHVTFVRANYTFTVSAGTGCTITVAGVAAPPVMTVPYKGSITFDITANTGYDLVDVKKDNVSQGPVPSVTFSNVDADHTIAATCARKQFTITPTWASGGSINPATIQMVFYGDSITFNIVADTGYVVDNVLVDGVSQGAITSYTFPNVTANHTIFATFKLKTFVITAVAGANGVIAPAGEVTVNYGGSQTFVITPNTGYLVGDVRVDGVSVGPRLVYMFNNVTSNHTIEATFVPAAYKLFLPLTMK